MVRPHMLVQVGVMGFALWCVWLAVSGIQDVGITQAWRSAAFFTVLSIWLAGTVMRERVVIQQQGVRVIRLFSVDDLGPTDIVAVRRAHGRGRPVLVELRDDRETNSRYLNTAEWPPFPRHVGVAPIPSLMSSARLAAALGVPRTYWPGQEGNQIEDADLGWVLRAFLVFLGVVAMLIGILILLSR